jgi:hypothetical protein
MMGRLSAIAILMVITACSMSGASLWSIGESTRNGTLSGRER